MTRKHSLIYLQLASVLLTLAACTMPTDPEDTYQRVHKGILRVGLTEQAPWVIIHEDRYSGTEVQLVKRLAEQLDAEIEWQEGSESVLLESLERNELDLVIGGLKKSIPWKTVAFTKPYLVQGENEHVLALALGENRWLLELEKFLNGPTVEAIVEP